MTGRRNRAHAPSRFFPAGKVWFLPPRPSLPSGFIFGSKNGIERIFSLSKQPQNSVRTSLVPLSICLWEVRACGGRRGVKNAAVSRRPLQSCSKLSHRLFKKHPSIRKLNNLFFMKVFAPLFSKSVKVFAQLFQKAFRLFAN